MKPIAETRLNVKTRVIVYTLFKQLRSYAVEL
ncbi:hypothetical protein CCP3SC5AM1_1850001 [Gammaproteobacteria bacterium]